MSGNFKRPLSGRKDAWDPSEQVTETLKETSEDEGQSESLIKSISVGRDEAPAKSENFSGGSGSEDFAAPLVAHQELGREQKEQLGGGGDCDPSENKSADTEPKRRPHSGLPPQHSSSSPSVRKRSKQQAAEAENDASSDDHIRKMWQGKSNVMVAVRVRPLSESEGNRNLSSIVNVVDDHLVVVRAPSTAAQQADVLRQHRSREKRYAFDHAFSPSASTPEVYKKTTSFLIDGVVAGYNATVFAYGATGAGKTYTMLGSRESQTGIMFYTLRDLFKKIGSRVCVSKSQSLPGSMQRVRSYKVTCSFLEVYNEMIRDLLTPGSDYLDLREDPVKGPVVAGLSEVEAGNVEDVMSLVRKGNSRRTTEGTRANATSSRSHAVLSLVVENRDEGVRGSISNVTTGKLSLIDLAGSERAAVTQNKGIRLVEGANINRSLLALGNCINALRSDRRGTFVPYRDSKLTRLLKDSLGGNCRTVMIAVVSPASDQMEETLNTLKYANRAKNIKTRVERNVLNVDYHVSEYVNLISRLKGEITSLRSRLKKGPKVTKQADSGKDSKRLERKRNKVEVAQMSFLREQVVLNFKERMQLRRSLIEIEVQNMENQTELEMHQLAIVRWDDHVTSLKKMRSEEKSMKSEGKASYDEGGEEEEDDLYILDEPKSVAKAREESSKLERANLRNLQLKVDTERRLALNEDASKALREKMETRITSEGRKELMELEYRIGMLELENMELERSKMLHRRSTLHKDSIIERLLAQVEVRDNIINALHEQLSAHGVLPESVHDAIRNFSPMLEPFDMLRVLPTGLPLTPSTPQGSGGEDRRINPRTSMFGLVSPSGPRVQYPLDRLEEELQRIERMKLESQSSVAASSATEFRKAPSRSNAGHIKHSHSQGHGRRQGEESRAKRKHHLHLNIPPGRVKKQHPYFRHHGSSNGSLSIGGANKSNHASRRGNGRSGRGGQRKSRNQRSNSQRWLRKMKTYLSPRQRNGAKRAPPRKMVSDSVVYGTAVAHAKQASAAPNGESTTGVLPPISGKQLVDKDHASRQSYQNQFAGHPVPSGGAKDLSTPSSTQSSASSMHAKQAKGGHGVPESTASSSSASVTSGMTVTTISMRSESSFAPVAPAPIGTSSDPKKGGASARKTRDISASGSGSARRPVSASEMANAESTRRGRVRGRQDASQTASEEVHTLHRSLSPRGEKLPRTTNRTDGAADKMPMRPRRRQNQPDKLALATAEAGLATNLEKKRVDEVSDAMKATSDSRRFMKHTGKDPKENRTPAYPVTSLNRERRISLEKLNKKIASIRKQVNGSGKAQDSSSNSTSRSENPEAADEMPEHPQLEKRESKRDAKEFKRLERLWGELEFVLRRPIQSESDIEVSASLFL